MSKAQDSFLEKVGWPVVLLVATSLLTLIGSKLQSGAWLTWMRAISPPVYVATAALFVWILLAILVIRRVRHLKARNLPELPTVFSVPAWGYVTVGNLSYKNVNWRIQIPAHAPWRDFALARARSERIDVETPPHCPKCDTKLEETETLFGSYRWSCLRCAFMQKNDMSFYHEAVRARKLAQADWERILREQGQ